MATKVTKTETPSAARARAYSDFSAFRIGRLNESEEYLIQLRNILDEYEGAIEEELAARAKARCRAISQCAHHS